MRISKLWAILASAALLLALQLSAPTPAHADTYNIVANWSEHTWGFQGIDLSGDVYLRNFYSDTYETQILSPTGNSTITTSNLPLTFIQDRGTYCQESLAGFSPFVRGVCNGNNFVFLYAADGGPLTSLYKYSGTGTPQLVTPAYFGDIVAMDSFGDIVFDNGNSDQAYYAIDLTNAPTTAPEPSTLLLLGTGILALAMASRRRPVQACY